MNDFPRLSDKEAVILALLSQMGPTYGLDMVKNSQKRLKRGTIYVTLDRMTDKGYVESWLEQPKEGEQGPHRRIYKITGRGAQVFNLWQAWQELQKANLSSTLQLGGA